MTDYILDGWGDKDLWVLNNASWYLLFAHDDLITGSEDAGTGFGERAFSDLYNVNWRFSISSTIYADSTTPLTKDKIFYLDGDANPIIFRVAYGPGNFPKVYSIIYNGDIKDQISVGVEGVGHTRVYKIGTIYYFTDENLTFDYGSKRKPIKLRLASTGGPPEDECTWTDLSWYYTQNLNLLRGDAIIF